MAELLQTLSGLIWGTPMLLLMGGTGLFLTVRLRALPQRRLGSAVRGAFGRGERTAGGGVTGRQALCTALAGTVGTGNVAGVAAALALGGPGAILWMWVAALLGMATKYAEVALAVRLRTRDGPGGWTGGPMVFIERGLGRRAKPLSVLFCVAGMGAALAMGNMTQMSVVTAAVNTAAEACVPGACVPPLAFGIPAALLLALVLLGGARGVGRAAERLVPLMSALYLFGTLAVIGTHLAALPDALGAIFRGAVSPAALGGGLAGVSVRAALRAGLARGVFSNEAGLGSAPMAYAAAADGDPARQGLNGVFEVFADTIVLCTLTALAILCSGVPIPYGGQAGSALLTAALGTVFYGPLPAVLTAAALALFALSSALSWGLYGARCAAHLFGPEAGGPFRLLFCVCAALGSAAAPAFAWDLADVCNGLMAAPNLLALLLLSGEAGRTARGLERPPRGVCSQRNC